MAAHTYWRLNVSASNGSGVTTIAEMEMHTSIGGSDVCSGGTAGGTNINGSYPASQAFDDNLSTLCVSSAQPNTISYQFASPQTIVEYAIVARGDGFLSDSPKTWTFEYSDDGSTWTVIDSESGQTSWSLGEKRTFTTINKYALTGVAAVGNAGGVGGDAPGAGLYSLRPATAGTTPTGNGAREPVMRSAGPATTVSGTVTVLGVATAGLIVRAYDKISGAMVGQATTNGSGNYSINCGGFTDVYVAAFDPTTYQAIIYDEVVPG